MSDATATVRELLLGDEAIALGAVHAGITGAFAYPGTPSTEIFEYVERLGDETIAARWSTNEKTAMEEALGMSYAGRRALVSMKHVGLNVAADPFMNSAITGVNGGIVLVVADDPGMHSSQNEQDSRYYAHFALIPCLEPSNQQMAYEMVRSAFDLSEELKLPVMVRIVTRLAHSRAAVTPYEPRPQNPLSPDASAGWVLLPSIARKGYTALTEKQPAVAKGVEDLGCHTRLGPQSGKVGIIATGIAQNYVTEALPDDSDLPRLYITGYPLAEKPFDAFLTSVDEVILFEDGYPFVEEKLRGFPLRGRMNVHGRLDGTVPRTGELTPDIVREALASATPEVEAPTGPLAPRPPALCSGCPHAITYQVLNSVLESMNEARVFSDIGCYTLGALPPYESIHSCVDMGASVTMSIGAARAGLRPSVALIGDSTFMHSGMTGLVDAVNEDTPITLIIVDNATVGMTGGQRTAATGERLLQVVTGLGVPKDHIRTVDPTAKKSDEIAQVFEEEFTHEGVSVIVASRPCVQEIKRIAREKKAAKQKAAMEKAEEQA